MKQIILYLILSTVSIVSVTSKNIDDLLNEYSRSPHANYVSFDSATYSNVKNVIQHHAGQDLANKVNSMSILHLGKCTEQTKYRFKRHLLLAETQDYLSLKDDEEMSVLIKKNEIILISKIDLFIIKLEGNFTNNIPNKIEHESIALVSKQLIE